MNVFYTPVFSNDKAVLDESESLHAVKVLRLKQGDRVLLMDGKGTTAVAEIVQSHPKKCELSIIETAVVPSRKFHLHIGIAPTKLNDRMEWFLEKAVEVGVEEITPVICDRSERKIVNRDRFLKVLIAAMKQSMNPWLPVLNETVDFENMITEHAPGFIAHCMDKPRIPLKEAIEQGENLTVLIGPEGDFTPAELDEAIHNKWVPVSLGNTRLRTETAGIVACHTIALLKS